MYSLNEAFLVVIGCYLYKEWTPICTWLSDEMLEDAFNADYELGRLPVDSEV